MFKKLNEYPFHAGSESSNVLKKYQYIDLMRGIAIFGVIAVHCHQKIPDLFFLTRSIFNYGQLGVQLFFVASALTLCLSMSQRRETDSIKFYMRRFFRIAPLYYFGIFVYFFWRVLKHYWEAGEVFIADRYSLVAVVENVLFIHGFDPRNFNFIVPGGWSIAVEMMFYAIFPMLFRIQSGLGFSGFLKLAIVVAFASLFFQILAIELIQPFLISKGLLQKLYINDDFGFIYSSIVNQINVFMVGILSYQKIMNLKVSRTSLFFAFVLCVASCYLLNVTDFKTGYNGFFYPLLSAIAFGVFAVKLAGVGELKNRVARFFVSIGRISFSMYLLHFLLLDLIYGLCENLMFNYVVLPEIKLIFLFSIVLALTYFFARLTYVAIENPGIEFGKKIHN